MLKVAVTILLLGACFAQEHLTCMKTDQILTQSNRQPPLRRLQGPPGKLGPRGQTGPRGGKGSKGEPGTSGNQNIGMFRGEFISFSPDAM